MIDRPGDYEAQKAVGAWDNRPGINAEIERLRRNEDLQMKRAIQAEAEIERLQQLNEALATEVINMRKALIPIAVHYDMNDCADMAEYEALEIQVSDLRACRNALGFPEQQTSDPESCPKCQSRNWPSVNWRQGQSYAYCCDCGYEETP